MNLEIKDTTYSFRFGMGFLRKINKTKNEFNGATAIPAGLKYAIAGLLDEDPEALALVLKTANETEQPIISSEKLDAYLEDENTDLSALCEEVRSFLSKANVCKKIYQDTMSLIENEQKKNEA